MTEKNIGASVRARINNKAKADTFFCLPMRSIPRHASCCYLDRMKISIVNLNLSQELIE